MINSNGSFFGFFNQFGRPLSSLRHGPSARAVGYSALCISLYSTPSVINMIQIWWFRNETLDMTEQSAPPAGWDRSGRVPGVAHITCETSNSNGYPTHLF
jgi:hypothetical protein